MVQGGAAFDPCPVGPAGPDAVIPTASSSCPYPSPSKQSIIDAGVAAAIAGGTNVTVTVCYGSGCTGNTDTTNNARGEPITVVLTSNVSLVVPALLGPSSFHISGSSTLVVNN